MKKIVPVLIALTLTTSVFAQEGPQRERGQRTDRRERSNADNNNAPGRNIRGGDRTNTPAPSFNFQDQRAEAEAKIKEKFPEEYAKIENERKETEAKLQELAKKAEVTLPLSAEARREQMENFRKKYAKELEEIEKLRANDPRAAMEKMRELYNKEGIQFGGGMMMRGGRDEAANEAAPPERGPRANQMDQMRENLKAKYPEEFAKIEALRRDDPPEYRRQLNELIKKYNTEFPPPKPE